MPGSSLSVEAMKCEIWGSPERQDVIVSSRKQMLRLNQDMCSIVGVQDYSFNWEYPDISACLRKSPNT